MLKSPEKQTSASSEVRLGNPIEYYKSNKFFCHLQAVLLTTAISVVSTIERNIEITEMPTVAESKWMTISLETSENPSPDENEQDDLTTTIETKQPDRGLSDLNSDAPENTLATEKAEAFQEQLSKFFATDRQKLIDKYQPHFSSKSITYELFDEFLFEYSSALETAIQKTKRDLDENQLSDDEILSQIERNQKQLKEFLERSESIVRRSKDKEMAISGIIKHSIKYRESQASVNGMFNFDQPEGNCVVRALVAANLALKNGLPKVAFALESDHITTVSTNNGVTTVMDTVLQKSPRTTVGTLVEGGRMLASLLAVTPNSGKASENSKDGNGNSAYEGLSPTGPNSNLQTPPRPTLQKEDKILTDEEYKALSIKYARDLSHLGNLEIQEEIKISTEMIEDEKLRTELLGKLLNAANKAMSNRDFWDAKNEITEDMARKIRSNFSNPDRIKVDEALEKSDLVRNFLQLKHIGSYKIKPLTIESFNESQNRRFNSNALEDSFSLIFKPNTLRSLHGVIETIDISNLQNLGELTGEYQENKPDEELAVNYNTSVEQYKEETEELQPLQIIRIHTNSSQLVELSQLDLSNSQSIFGIKKPLKEVELEKLNGFSGIINFAIDKNVDLSILDKIDLSRAKIALDYRLMIKDLLIQNVDTFIIADESNLRYLIEHNILQALKAKLLIIKVDPSEKEFLRLAEKTATFGKVNSRTHIRIESF
jgi:hypothetical protein